MSDNKDNEIRDKRYYFREVCSWIAIVGFAIVAAYLLNNFVIVNARVPSGSMEDTIATKSKIIGLRFAYWFDEPERGDIIIFEGTTKNYVKRIIGLPGEKLRIKDAKVYITPVNGGEEFVLEEDYLKEEWTVLTGSYEYEIPEDSYFVMGDNRNYSIDARSWEDKYIHKDTIMGKAVLCYSPKLYFMD